MMRAIWSCIMLLLFGGPIALNDRERAEEMERFRHSQPEMFEDKTDVA